MLSNKKLHVNYIINKFIFKAYIEEFNKLKKENQEQANELKHYKGNIFTHKF